MKPVGNTPTTRDLKMKSTSSDIDISQVSDEQLPVAKHKLKGWKHFMGLYAGEQLQPLNSYLVQPLLR